MFLTIGMIVPKSSNAVHITNKYANSSVISHKLWYYWIPHHVALGHNCTSRRHEVESSGNLNNEIILHCYRLVFLSCMTIVLPFLPASNLFLTVGFVLAERILYIPSAGYCLLIAIGYDNIIRKLKLEKVRFFLISLIS